MVPRWCRRCEDAASTALHALCLLARAVRGQTTTATVALRLVAILWVLLLVAKLLLFSKRFPLVLDLDRLVLPLLADDL